MNGKRLTGALSILLALQILIFAQSDTARISGTITDANGAIVAGAIVTLTNEKTGETRTAVVTGEGTFQIAALKPALYAVTASANDFETATQKNLELLVGQEASLNLVLQLPGVAAQVDIVSTDETALNISSANMSANVNPREVQGLPLNGRQLLQLYLQAPGAQNTGSGTFGDIRFNGRAVQQNIIRYDGIESSAVIDASPGNLNGEIASPFRLQSSLENVQEFRGLFGGERRGRGFLHSGRRFAARRRIYADQSRNRFRLAAPDCGTNGGTRRKPANTIRREI